MTIFEIAKELIIGTRLKRISERFLSDVSLIYKESGIDFEPSWFGIFFLLNRYGTLTVSEIAYHLDITQSGASQIISLLEKKGLIEIRTGEKDKRKKVVSLTQDGIELLRKIKPVWKLMRANMREILDEGENSRYLLEALSEIESAFLKSSLSERVLKSMHESQYTVSLFKDKYYNSLKKLIFHWAFDFYAPDFINNLKEITQKNLNNITVALKDREVIAAVFSIEDNKGFLRLFLCDKDDVDNNVLISIFKDFLKDRILKIESVEFDSDKSVIRNMLEDNGFCLENERCFNDTSKKLVVYKRCK